MAITLNTTNFSLPRIRLCELVAACPSFQQAVGVSPSSSTPQLDAMAHVLSPFSDDHVVNGVMANPRPRATININRYTRHKRGTAFGASQGGLILCFEFLPKTEPVIIAPPFGTEDWNIQDPNERLAHFEEQIGKILDEMEARVAQDKAPGDAIFTASENPATTHLNQITIDLVAGPAECNEQEEEGDLFMTAIFLVDYQ